MEPGCPREVAGIVTPRVGGHHRYASLSKTHAEDFAQLEDIGVVVQSPPVEPSSAYAARLAGALRDGGLGTARVSYRIDASRLVLPPLVHLGGDRLRSSVPNEGPAAGTVAPMASGGARAQY